VIAPVGLFSPPARAQVGATHGRARYSTTTRQPAAAFFSKGTYEHKIPKSFDTARARRTRRRSLGLFRIMSEFVEATERMDESVRR